MMAKAGVQAEAVSRKELVGWGCPFFLSHCVLSYPAHSEQTWKSFKLGEDTAFLAFYILMK